VRCLHHHLALRPGGRLSRIIVGGGVAVADPPSPTIPPRLFLVRNFHRSLLHATTYILLPARTHTAGDFIPHDHDLDVFVPIEDMDKVMAK
jgi:hypothetical protein